MKLEFLDVLLDFASHERMEVSALENILCEII